MYNGQFWNVYENSGQTTSTGCQVNHILHVNETGCILLLDCIWSDSIVDLMSDIKVIPVIHIILKWDT